MRMLALLLISVLSLASRSAFAASYQTASGTIIDPIQSVFGGNLSYSGSNLEPGALLDFANLSNADLRFANLSNADLRFANLSNAFLVATDLNNANLSGAFLDSADLDGAFLFFADLSDARLGNADLFNANLDSANLSNAFLSGAELRFANLSSADLSSADLTFANLSSADLSNAILLNAVGLSSSAGAAFYDINTDFTGTGFDPVTAGWTLIPEPNTALLLSLGLVGMTARRRA